jgi:hypothetical protein
MQAAVKTIPLKMIKPITVIAIIVKVDMADPVILLGMGE